MARIYATHEQLVAYTEGSSFVVPAEPESQRVRTRASEFVDDALLTAVYATDPVTELPTDRRIEAALRDAVCAQVVWWDETGDELGDAGQYTSASIGSVSLTRGRAAAGVTLPSGRTLGPHAATHLRLAGLLPGVVISTY
ncbi:hypothetical protein [Actinophytocola sediminis]